MIRFCRVIPLLFVASLFACDNDKNPIAPEPDVPVLAKVSGDAQQVVPGQPTPQPLVVIVTSADGDPLESVEVTWTVVSGGGTLSSSSSITDATGKASITWTPGTAGGQLVRASIDASGAAAVTFTAFNITPVLTIAAGDAQQGAMAAPLDAPLVVLVRTPTGAPMANVKVNWGVEAGGGSVSAPSSITDQDGKASINWTLGLYVNETVKAWTDIEGSQSVLFKGTGFKTLVLHFDGTNWIRSLNTSNIAIYVYSGWAPSSALAFATGHCSPDPFALRYDNGVWSGMEKCNSTSLLVTGMSGTTANDVWAVARGSGGTMQSPWHSWVYHFGPPTVTSYDETDTDYNPDLRGVSARSSDDVIAVGLNGKIVRHGGSTWSAQTSGTTRDLYGVWGDPNSASVFAVGDAGTVVYHDGSSWRALTSRSTENLRGVWGSSPTNVFAVGAHGTILHFDGSAWTAQASGTTQDLKAVWGSSPTSIYAVGGTAILHYDGTSWTPVPVDFRMNYTGVWGTSAANVFVSGAPIGF